MSLYRVVLADDHPLFRQGIRSTLDKNQDMEVVGEASDGLELVQLVKKLAPHMVIIDLSMPNLGGIDAIREVRQIDRKVKILVLTMHRDQEYVCHAMEAGASGYVLKDAGKEDLLSAIETCRRNKCYIHPHLQNGLGNAYVEGFFAKKGNLLSSRERTVLKLIAEGKSCKEIGEILYISARTVEHHRENMKKKLGLKSTAELIKYAVEKAHL